MMPLALILKAQGHDVSGSDRAYDQGLAAEKFFQIKNEGIYLYPQDGSGVDESQPTILVVSGAIELTVPDVKAAKEIETVIQTRAQLLASIFNDYEQGISIAGTSGKSTVTGMVSTVLQECGLDPTVMNGGMISNFEGSPSSAASNMRVGSGNFFVTETDESDGSIALYNPAISVVNNIALDHMPLDELTTIFTDFIKRTKNKAIINADNDYCASILRENNLTDAVTTFGLNNGSVRAINVNYKAYATTFNIKDVEFKLNITGKHNVYNALAAICVATECGLHLSQISIALEKFTGIKRRLQTIGTKNDITVIDDFGHNPDKIAATLDALKLANGRIIIMFQPHGFAPLRLMGKEIIDSFVKYMSKDDMLLMPEVYYAGGTVDRTVTSKDIISLARERGLNASWFSERAHILPYIIENARPYDRVIIMGARDDSLTDFAKAVLAAL